MKLKREHSKSQIGLVVDDLIYDVKEILENFFYVVFGGNAWSVETLKAAGDAVRRGQSSNLGLC